MQQNHRTPHKKRLLLAMATGLAATAHAQETAPIKALGIVTVTSGQPSSLPTQIPTTMESTFREQISETVNATDAEDALKYLPSLLVRKRYIGDYNHAVLSSRASGTGNSARSAVYADGILLSNFLGNGVSGLSFPPRWGLVTPEEIERVDVMYGPFSAAYPGNSAGAVVDYVTRMPQTFEAHAKVSYTVQPFSLYHTDSTYRAWQSSASVGNRSGDWAWFFNVNHTDSTGQPLTFVTRKRADGVAGTGGAAVTGAVQEHGTGNEDILVLGTGTQYHTVQDHLKVKLAYDVTPTLRASYVLGVWQNMAEGRPESYLRTAAGQPFYSGGFNVNGMAYNGAGTSLRPTEFALTQESLLHTMHGLSLKRHTQGVWDWSMSVSAYGYGSDLKRQGGSAMPAVTQGGKGTIADGNGTGWYTLDLKGTWRPEGLKGAHIVDTGYQLASHRLSYLTSDIGGNWLNDGPGAMSSNVGGRTQLQSLYAQDTWTLARAWKAVLGLRAEQWRAHAGYTQVAGTLDAHWPQRQVNALSPKAALSYQLDASSVIKASAGRAVRMPTVAELYGATSTANAQYLNDPNLKPERSWTAELSYEKDLLNAQWRLTWFGEDAKDSIFSQTLYDTAASQNITRVQNVGRIKTQGLETAISGSGIGAKALDLGGSLTFTRSIIESNDGFVLTPNDTLGKWQPNIARWRATALATYRFDDRLSATLAARYSGRQYRTLNNADVNGQTYMGVSPCFSVDLRLRYRVGQHLTAAFGIDNLNNSQYWNFHPYPQRSYHAELKFDL